MPNTKISQLPEYITGSASGSYLVMNDSTETTTFKVTRENLLYDYTASYALTSSIALLAIQAISSSLLDGFHSYEFAKLNYSNTFTADQEIFLSGSRYLGTFEGDTFYILDDTSKKEIGLSNAISHFDGPYTAGIYVSSGSNLDYRTAFEIPNGPDFIGDGLISFKLPTNITGSLNVTGGITGSFQGDGSGLNNVYAVYALGSTSASFASASISSSYALNSLYASNTELLNNTSSGAFAITGSNIFKGSQTIYGNLFMSGSFPLVYNNDSTNNMLYGMFDGSTIYGPYYQLFGNLYSNLSQRGGAEFVYDIRNNPDANFHISSFNGSTWTQKFLVNDNGAQITGSLIVTNGITGSLLGTASYAKDSDLLDGKDSSTFATTGSNIFNGTQTVTGSVYISGNLIVQGSSSLQNITASAVSIGTNTVILNTNYPSIRFGGISVYDSGSAGTTGSLWWDSQNNVWLYQNPGGASYTSARLISGPQNTGSLGSESGLTTGKIPVAVGDDHIGDSIMTQTGTTISIGGNLSATSLTGSLSGSALAAVSASYATTALYAPNYVLNTSTSSLSVLSSSFAITASHWTGPLSSLTDVTDYSAPTITDGYQLAWNSGSQLWAPAAGAAAKGVTRLFVSANRANSAAFYFTSITVTADSKASPDANTAFMVTSTLLSKVTLYLREDAAGTNSTRVDITKNANGAPFANATSSIANSTVTLSQNTVGTYSFTGLTLNQFDSIHVKVTPTSSPGQMYGIVIVE